MFLPVAPTKKTLREEMKQRARRAGEEEFRSRGAGAAALLCSSKFWLCYQTVFLFLSMNHEIDTQPLLEAALTQGKKVFVPRTDTGGLTFLRVLSPYGPWQKGPFGIREPIANTMEKAPSGKPASPVSNEDFPALIIVPGLAFDRSGNRLGRGAGYYDRFFAKLDEEGREYLALGLCMDFQLIDKVPADAHDKKTRGVLTGTELIPTNLL